MSVRAGRCRGGAVRPPVREPVREPVRPGRPAERRSRRGRGHLGPVHRFEGCAVESPWPPAWTARPRSPGDRSAAGPSRSRSRGARRSAGGRRRRRWGGFAPWSRRTLGNPHRRLVPGAERVTTGVWVARKPAAGRGPARCTCPGTGRRRAILTLDQLRSGRSRRGGDGTARPVVTLQGGQPGPRRPVPHPGRAPSTASAPLGPVETVSSTVGGESTGAQVAVARNGTAWVATTGRRSPDRPVWWCAPGPQPAPEPAARVDTGELGRLASAPAAMSRWCSSTVAARVAVLPRGERGSRRSRSPHATCG